MCSPVEVLCVLTIMCSILHIIVMFITLHIVGNNIPKTIPFPGEPDMDVPSINYSRPRSQSYTINNHTDDFIYIPSNNFTRKYI